MKLPLSEGNSTRILPCCVPIEFHFIAVFSARFCSAQLKLNCCLIGEATTATIRLRLPVWRESEHGTLAEPERICSTVRLCFSGGTPPSPVPASSAQMGQTRGEVLASSLWRCSDTSSTPHTQREHTGRVLCVEREA
jgi:hypothetical protein|uniref:Uncharacterized protein n=1 Tax=Bionectria ochroleuca TaxID=29856 RepID=A0A8H7N9C6_BIOOC